MRAVVIGGSGQIGGWLLNVLSESGHEAIGTYRSVPVPGLEQLDAANLEAAAFWLRSKKPDVVFYPAGFTWVDGCERDPEQAFAANRDQPVNLARAAGELGARFVAFSTDYVFDGTAGPYAEDSATHPLSVYGKAKLAAEHALEELLGDSLLTIRTSWVFGPERQGKNFAYQVVRTLRQGKDLAYPNDMTSNPSYGPDVARAALRLAEQGASGCIHVAGPEVIDRFRFAVAIAEGFGIDAAGIRAVPNAELPQQAPRPLQGGLRTERLERCLPGVMRNLDEALRDFRAATANEAEDWADPLGMI